MTEQTNVSTRRVLLASLAGTAIEFFDFYIYATAAVLVFPQLFFPSTDPTTAMLQSFATFSLAFFARPIGAVFFGHFGDRIGRKATLVAALLTMGLSTIAIGLLPTYETAGIWAPLLLAVCRFLQGFGLGGEWGGAVLLATENAPAGRKAWFGMFPQLGAPIGFLCSSGIFLAISALLTDEQFVSYGWRLPFLASAALVVVGLYVRLRISETPAFQRAMQNEERVRVPVVTILKRHLGLLVFGTVGALATFVLFYLTTVFALSWGISALGYTREQFLPIQMLGVVFFGITIPISAALADRYGRRKILLIATALIAIFGLLFEPLFGSGSTAGVVAFMVVGLGLMGLTYGPLGTALSEPFPVSVRYTGASLAFNLAEEVELLEKADVQKAVRKKSLADRLNDAVMTDGTLAIDIGANLTTSRLVSFGFLAEAKERGITTYQVNEVLDDRTCPVCQYMHGKTFEVAQEYTRVLQALTTQDPKELQSIAPWPRQSKAGLSALNALSASELQTHGYGSPPYHPGCRGVLSKVGTVEERVELGKLKVQAPAPDRLTPIEGPVDDLLANDFAHINRRVLEDSHGKLADFYDESRSHALSLYTGGTYEHMNAVLRGGTTELDIGFVKEKIADLNKLMKPTSSRYTVFRGHSLERFKKLGLKAGESVELRGFTSTSRSAEVAATFSTKGSGGVLYQVNMPKGAKAIVTNEFEAEIILPHDSTLKIVKIIDTPNGIPGFPHIKKVIEAELVTYEKPRK